MAEFYVGQRVVCVDDGYDPSRYWEFPVSRGAIYTISAIVEDGRPFYRGGGKLAFHLNGVLRRNGAPLAAERFRPLEYKAMEIFRAIAANPKIKIRENA